MTARRIALIGVPTGAGAFAPGQEPRPARSICSQAGWTARSCTLTSTCAPRLAGITVTELNPDHVEEGADSVERLVMDLARGLGDH